MSALALRARAVVNSHWFDACPCCGSTDLVRLGAISYASPTLFSTAEITLTRVPELWECRCCQSKFTRNSVTEQDAVELYGVGSSGERWRALEFTEQQRGEVVRALEAYLHADAVVADIGCNTGEFLDFARSRGCKTKGVEFSRVSRDVAAAKGHAMYSSIEELDDASADVIAAFDLVEHLYHTAEFMAVCHRKLRRGGKFIIVTGDPQCVAARLYGAKWWYAAFPEHVVFPSKVFFSEHTKFRMESAVATYASKASRLPIWQVARNALYGILHGQAIAPQIGPDHMLVVLGKHDLNAAGGRERSPKAGG